MQLKDIENLAELSKIELSPEEKESLLSDMEGILEYVNQIKSVEIEDRTTEYGLRNVFREDDLTGDAERDFSKDLIVEQFPDLQDGFLKVKKII